MTAAPLDELRRDCPTCGRRERGRPYDIGSGPEFACPDCETCWGAHGQPLRPLTFVGDVKLPGTHVGTLYL